TVLAESWQERGEAPEYESLYDRREPYERGAVPAGGLVLTAGVDVQADRLEAEVVAWGPGLESWSVDYFVLAGNPAEDPQVWLDLEQRLLRADFPHELGGRLAVAHLCVDTGHAAHAVYDWARQQPASRVTAIKGYGPLASGL